MPGTSTCDGSDGATPGAAAGDELDGDDDGVVACAPAAETDVFEAPADGEADDAVADDGEADDGPLDDGPAAEDGATGGGADRAGCVCAGNACGPRPVPLPHADNAATASSGSVGIKNDKRRT